jgi:aryl-alcohol dehydrogenase-like predicted oxidoreductase
LTRSIAGSFVLGTWGLAGTSTAAGSSYGPVGARVAEATFDRAWAMGMRVADTAPAYGGGAGLRRLAAWQRSRRVRWRVSAKPGRPWTAGGPASTLDQDDLLAEVQATADLVGPPAYVLIKDPDPASYHDGRLDRALDRLERRLPGVTVGVAGHLPEAVLALRRPERPRVAQIELNAVNRFVSVPAAVRLAAAGWEVWAMQPLAYGFLARPDRGPEHDQDWRGRIPAHVRTALGAAARAFAGAAGAGPGPDERAAAAIAFCLSVPAVSRVVVGPRHPRQLDAVPAALKWVADPAAARRLAALTAPFTAERAPAPPAP